MRHVIANMIAAKREIPILINLKTEFRALYQEHQEEVREDVADRPQGTLSLLLYISRAYGIGSAFSMPLPVYAWHAPNLPLFLPYRPCHKYLLPPTCFLRVPQTLHRASSILAELKLAEHAKGLAANADKDIPTFRPGDSIEVKMVTHLTSTETDTYRGVVLSVRKNGADTRFTLADVRI